MYISILNSATYILGSIPLIPWKSVTMGQLGWGAHLNQTYTTRWVSLHQAKASAWEQVTSGDQIRKRVYHIWRRNRIFFAANPPCKALSIWISRSSIPSCWLTMLLAAFATTFAFASDPHCKQTFTFFLIFIAITFTFIWVIFNYAESWTQTQHLPSPATHTAHFVPVLPSHRVKS